MAEIITISAASAAIGILIGLRVFEARRGEKTAMSRSAARLDPFFASCGGICIRTCRRSGECVYVCVRTHVPRVSDRVYASFRNCVERLTARFRRHLRGERMLRNTGSVSFFLRNIHESKRVRRQPMSAERESRRG